jgi:pSer/pThr/pTyr-binding forkhead associated (FHA) protein
LPEGGLPVTRFPFRIGRATEAHEPDALDLNDLWLLDPPPFNVSRNHMAIDVTDRGVVVKDRGSHLGTLVNDDLLGGRASARMAELYVGDNVVILGGPKSPYQYRIHVAPER